MPVHYVMGPCLLLPQMDIDDSRDAPCITVWWQGDRHCASEVDGIQLASIALVDYAQFHSVGKLSQHLADWLKYLNQHFTFKTVEHLYLPYAEDELRAFGKVLDAVRRYAPDLAWEALKKSLI